MKTKNILVIGCGGIGCELIKILSVKGCKRLTLVDYDTISVSNLGRQFFFTIEDVNQFKCEIIAKKYRNANKNAIIHYHTDSIMNSKFDYNFFKGYDLVFNCLDNQESRSFVSKRCAFTNTPIIDGGSNGFFGQAWFYMRDVECYDCLEKQKDSDIPVCTIRTNPRTYEHCVIWTKQYFLHKLFITDEHKNIDNLILSIVKEGYVIKYNVCEDIKKTCTLLTKDNIMQYNKNNQQLNDVCIAVTNLRAESFGIKALTRFETETMLGNIVPIMGTTNAIVASLMYQIGTDYFNKQTIGNFYIIKNKRIINRVKSLRWMKDCSFCNSNKLLLYKTHNITLDTLLVILEKHGIVERVFDSNNIYYDSCYLGSKGNMLDFHNNDIFYAKIDQNIYCILVIEGSINKITNICNQIK